MTFRFEDHLQQHTHCSYFAETQDEKMYRVVMDRERWFSVVMGERYQVDARSTEKLAQRVPAPESLARGLAFRLEAGSPAPDVSPQQEPQLAITR